MLFGKSRNLVGLDIGDSSVKVVELKELGKGRGYQLSKLGWEPLSSEAIVDGAIMDSQLVVDTIQRLFQRCGIKGNQVATAVSGHSVIVKRISLPVMSEAELAESIHWEAEQYIPFDIEDVNLDYQILEGSVPLRRRQHGRPAGRGQEGQDQRLHQRDQSGRAAAAGGRHRLLRDAERLRDQTTSSSRTR